MQFKHPLAILSWPLPNYVDPETRGPALYIVNSLFFGLATIIVALRLSTRIWIRKWFGLDDALILVAWFCGLGDMATIFWGYSHYNWDRHMWDGKIEMLAPGSKALFAAKLWWTTSSTCIRLSLLVLYYRLLNHLDMRKYRWALHCTTFFVLAIWASYLGLIIFACVPVDQYFAWPPIGRCIDEGLADTIVSALNTVSEALVAALPIPMIMRLGMLSTERWSVMALLCLGFLVSIVGSVRTYYVWHTFESDDLTWYSGPHWIASEVEVSVAMICASMPALRPVLTRVLRGDNIFTRAVHRGQASWLDRKANAALTTSASTSGRSFIGYEPYYRTVDLEGIGVDGLGYTVTISAGGSPVRKKNRFRKLVSTEEAEVKEDLESQGNVRRPKMALRLSSMRDRLRPRDSTHPVETDQGMEIVTKRTFDVVEESAEVRVGHTSTPVIMSRSASRSASRTGNHRQAPQQAEDPRSFFNETEDEGSQH